VKEGVLRDCVKAEDGFESLVVMSMLRREYEKARQATAPSHTVPLINLK
jgi:hypothetical protein